MPKPETIVLTDDIEQYEHHKTEVSVRTSLKGLHRRMCLCYICKKSPHLRSAATRRECRIREELYRLCVKFGLTTPVFECPEFEDERDPPDTPPAPERSETPMGVETAVVGLPTITELLKGREVETCRVRLIPDSALCDAASRY